MSVCRRRRPHASGTRAVKRSVALPRGEEAALLVVGALGLNVRVVGVHVALQPLAAPRPPLTPILATLAKACRQAVPGLLRWFAHGPTLRPRASVRHRIFARSPLHSPRAGSRL